MPFIAGVAPRVTLAGMLVMLAACHRNPEDQVTPVRVAPSDAIAYGDCVEARRRAAEKPDLPVEKIPAVVRQSPRPFQRMPASVKRVVDARGAVVKIDVIVDTLGHPVMSTFKVVETTHPWLAQNVKSVMPRWRFTPAELAGCKVARVFKFSATSRPRR